MGARETPPGGDRFGKFVRTRKLGSGGMGEVWQAWDEELSRWVALKLLKGTDAEEIARFKREAQTAARLTHPNIAAIFDVGEESGRHWIAMQFVEGQTLKTWPRTDRRLLVRLVRDAARAVEFANRQGVIHRDLKPDNLMATGKGDGAHAYVMDFGLARATEGASDLSVTGQILGTPNYMPPEQAHGERADARADVYSLGATLYEILTDRRPFTGENVYATLKKVMEDDPVAPRRIDPSVDADLETIVLKCLEKERNRRYASAGDLADELDRFLKGEAISSRPASVLYRARKFVKRRTSLVAAGALLAAGIGAGLWVLLWPGSARVTSTPEGAEILVDGRPTGRATPASVVLWPPGRHVIGVRLDRHLDASGEARPRAGQEVDVSFALEKTTGFVSVVTKPRGAEAVWRRDGTEIPLGRTPVDRAEVPRGPGTIVLRTARYSPLEAVVQVEPGALATVEKTLQPIYGSLAIESDQTGLQATYTPMDREDVADGHVPVPIPDMALALGRWRFTFVGAGRFPRVREIEIVENRPLRIRAHLEPILRRRLPLPSPAAALAVADFDRDGLADVAARSNDGFVHAVSGADGSELWKFYEGGTDMGEALPEVPLVADLDGDGVPDVAFAAGSGTVYAVSGRNGSEIWAASPELFFRQAAQPADMNGDGVPDVVGTGAKRVMALSGRDGRVVWEAEAKDELGASPAVGDLDGDGTPEVVVATTKGVAAYSGSEKLWEAEYDDPAWDAPMLADVNGDGVRDVVAASRTAGLLAFSGKDGELFWQNEALATVRRASLAIRIDGDAVPDFVAATETNVVAVSGATGMLLWQVLASSGNEGWIDMAGADVNGDGVDDAFVGPLHGRILAFSGKDGTALWEEGIAASTGPALADADGDGIAECVAADAQGVQFLAGSARTGDWSVAIDGVMEFARPCRDLDGDGTGEVAVEDIKGSLAILSGATGDRLWKAEGGREADMAPIVADLDGDGSPEVLAMLRGTESGKGWMAVYSTRAAEPIASYPWADGGSAWPEALDVNGDGRMDGLGWAEGTRSRFLAAGCGLEPAAVEIGAAAESPPGLADRDHDGRPEWLAVWSPAGVLAFRLPGGEPMWEVVLAVEQRTAPLLRDVDGDGEPDAVVRGADGIVAISGKTGEILWTIALEGVAVTPVVEDLDGDGAADVVTAADLEVAAWSGRSGGRLWTAPGFDMPSTPLVLDLAGDHAAGILVCDSGGLAALSAKDGSLLWRLPIPGDLQHRAASAGPAGPEGPAILVASSSPFERFGELRLVRARDGAVLRRQKTEPTYDTPPLALHGTAGPGLRVLLPVPQIGIRTLAFGPVPPPLAAAAEPSLRDSLWRDPTGRGIPALAAARLPAEKDKVERFLLLTATAEALLNAGDRAEALRALTALRDLGADSWLIRADLAVAEDSTSDLVEALRQNPDGAARALAARSEIWKGRSRACRAAAADLTGLPRAAAWLLCDDFDLALADLAAAEAAGAPHPRVARVRNLFPEDAASYLARATELAADPARCAALARLALARAGGMTSAAAAELGAEALVKLGKKDEAAAMLDEALKRVDLFAEDRAKLEKARAALK
ncbi:MAG: PQQ-binding-like beta-propeller repeat protein [Planctomycetes bacterium]|nr:PQQ-binding-like beta-propeller repeat protein [Planctomycetota bacterium]